MHKTIEYATETQEAFVLEAQGMKADGLRNRAEWARDGGRNEEAGPRPREGPRSS